MLPWLVRRYYALVIAGPLPNADAFGTVVVCGVHRQPLRGRMFAGNDTITTIDGQDCEWWAS
jgi:hypothetical protein